MNKNKEIINPNRATPLVNSPDHIYVNMTLLNNSFLDINSQNQYIPANVIQTFDQSIIDEPDQYNVTIVRFAVSSSYIARSVQGPLGDVVPGLNGATGAGFWVSLSYNGVYYDTKVIYPFILDSNNVLVRLKENIFAVMDAINAGFLTSQIAAVAGGAPTGPTGQQVLMTFDPVTELYAVNIPAFYGTGTVGVTGAGIGVGMSFFLYQHFNSFNTIVNNPLLYNSHDVTFQRSWLGDNLVSNLYTNVGTAGTGTTGVYMQLRQDAAWGSAIEDNCRLLITSSSLPFLPEYKATVDYIGTPSGNKVQPILTDFFIGRDSELQSKGQDFLYVPSLYRLTSLRGQTPITKIDLQLFLQDCLGFFYPLFLAPGGTIDAKLLFIRKGLSN